MSATNEQAARAPQPPAGDGRESAAHYELARQVGELFALGASVDDAVGDLTLPAMKMGFEPADGERLIRQFYATEISRLGPTESIARLARLDPVTYEKSRASEAKRLGMRASVLDREVEKVRPKNGAAAPGAADSIAPPPPVPWPHPVEGAELFDEINAALRHFVALSKDELNACVLWAAYAHCYARLDTLNPFLRLKSAEPDSGKSTLAKALSRIAASGMIVTRASAAALVRVVAGERKPALFLDESDSYLRVNEAARGIIDGAHDRETANVVLNVKRGDDWVPTQINVFMPLCIISIGDLDRTIESRSIPISLQRATPTEKARLFKARKRALDETFKPLGQKMARWISDNLNAVCRAAPKFPDSLEGREMDCWEPLFQIAQVVGGDWPERARAAAEALSGRRNAAAESVRIELLRCIKKLCAETDWLPSRQLAEALAADQTSRWVAYGRSGKPISERAIAVLLKPFGVFPASNGSERGYKAADFTDVFARYVPAPPAQVSKCQKPHAQKGNLNFHKCQMAHLLTDAKIQEVLRGVGRLTL